MCNVCAWKVWSALLCSFHFSVTQKNFLRRPEICQQLLITPRYGGVYVEVTRGTAWEQEPLASHSPFPAPFSFGREWLECFDLPFLGKKKIRLRQTAVDFFSLNPELCRVPLPGDLAVQRGPGSPAWAHQLRPPLEQLGTQRAVPVVARLGSLLPSSPVPQGGFPADDRAGDGIANRLRCKRACSHL